MKGTSKLGAALLTIGIALALLPTGIANALPEDTTDSRTEWVSADEGRTETTAAALWVVAPIRYDNETGESAAFPDGISIDIALGDGHSLNADEGFTVLTETNSIFDASRYTFTDLGSGTYRFDFTPLPANERFKVQFFTDITDNTRLDFDVQVFNNSLSADIETGVVILARAEAGDDGGEVGEPQRLVFVGIVVYIDTNGNGTEDDGEPRYTAGSTATISGSPALSPLVTDANGEAKTPTWEYQAGDENRTLTFTAPTGYTVAGQSSITSDLNLLANPQQLGLIFAIPIRPLEDAEPPAEPEPEKPPVIVPGPESDTPDQEAVPTPDITPVLAYTGSDRVGLVGWLALVFLTLGLIALARSWQKAEREADETS